MKTLVLLFLIISSSLLFSTTLYVDFLQTTNPANHIYTTINEANNASVDGDEIKIYPGDYFESITITKAISISGTTQSSTRIFRNNTIGFTINCTTGNVNVSDLYFISKSQTALYISGGCLPVTITNCIFDNSSPGIRSYTNSAVVIQNSIFRNCSIGILFYHTTNHGKIVNCIFHNNSDNAIYLDDSNTYSDIFGNVFVNNVRGVKRYYGGFYGSLSYNIFYNNSDYNISSSSDSGSGNLINVDPLLANISALPYYNYFPTNSSPCIDAGNPSPAYNDLDGTRNDIGIFGGSYPWGDGKPVVLDIQLNPNTVQQGGTFDIQATGQTK